MGKLRNQTISKSEKVIKNSCKLLEKEERKKRNFFSLESTFEHSNILAQKYCLHDRIVFNIALPNEKWIHL